MKFSERIGVTPVRSALQTSGMSDALRNSLWNVLDSALWSRSGFLYNREGFKGDIERFSRALWFHHFKKPIDSRRPDPAGIMQQIRGHYFECQWHEAYDFVEFVVGLEKIERLEKAMNSILERELAGFRFIVGRLVPVTDEQEVQAVTAALEDGPYKGSVAHIRQALDHLGNRQNPDYRNSIKESISAVESIAREITGNPKATLGDALTVIEKSGQLHPALKRGLSALYGYTSDEGGIRHAMLEEPELSASDAKFFLVACAAFANYLKAKVAHAI